MSEAYDRGSELRYLYDVTRASIDEAPADKRAALIARAESILQQLEALAPPAAKAGDPLDEIAERRAARGAATSRQGRATRNQG